MSIGMLLWSLAWFILFFVCLVIFAPYLSVFAFAVWFVYGAFKLIFNLFAYTWTSCSNINLMSNIFLTLLLFYVFYKIYHLFKWSSGS